jgi:hypothetical protein
MLLYHLISSLTGGLLISVVVILSLFHHFLAVVLLLKKAGKELMLRVETILNKSSIRNGTTCRNRMTLLIQCNTKQIYYAILFNELYIIEVEEWLSFIQDILDNNFGNQFISWVKL